MTPSEQAVSHFPGLPPGGAVSSTRCHGETETLDVSAGCWQAGVVIFCSLFHRPETSQMLAALGAPPAAVYVNRTCAAVIVRVKKQREQGEKCESKKKRGK